MENPTASPMRFAMATTCGFWRPALLSRIVRAYQQDIIKSLWDEGHPGSLAIAHKTFFSCLAASILLA